ncbi:hypothetical protein Taro_019396 [Colocasia esculenta]|uniref:Uncharacterized protein n=1 Tax=Colocasia esculenta TaxID=4460 RepID=A0A843UW69_COLES|nr:hypothetical protein [Colocasia esculenta]
MGVQSLVACSWLGDGHRELRPESLKVPGLDLQLCGLQRKLDLSSVTARLRGSSCVVLSGLDAGVMNQ